MRKASKAAGEGPGYMEVDRRTDDSGSGEGHVSAGGDYEVSTGDTSDVYCLHVFPPETTPRGHRRRGSSV